MAKTRQLTQGEAVRLIRERANIRLVDLARMTGLSQGLLSLVENGEHILPQETMERVDAALKKALKERMAQEELTAKLLKREISTVMPASSSQFVNMTVGHGEE